MENSPLSADRLEEFLAKAQSLIDTHRYFLDRMLDELKYVKDVGTFTANELIKATAYIYAHGGYHDLAINELNALISISVDNIHHQNKLAQVYIRRGREGDFDKAIEISSSVLKKSSSIDGGDAWLAYHNAALASFALGNVVDATSYGEAALKYRDDPRTRTIIAQARAPSQSDIKLLSLASSESVASGHPYVASLMSMME